MSRAAVFIDGDYLGKVLMNQFDGRKIDFWRLTEELNKRISDTEAEDVDLLRAYYYDALPWMPRGEEPTEEDRERWNKKRNFLYALEYLPRFEVRLGRVQREANEEGKVWFSQHGVNVALSVDLVAIAVRRQIQHAVIVAPDSDYLPAVQVAKAAGVIVHLAHGESPGVSKHLMKECDERFPISAELIDAATPQPDSNE